MGCRSNKVGTSVVILLDMQRRSKFSEANLRTSGFVVSPLNSSTCDLSNRSSLRNSEDACSNSDGWSRGFFAGDSSVLTDFGQRNVGLRFQGYSNDQPLKDTKALLICEKTWKNLNMRFKPGSQLSPELVVKELATLSGRFEPPIGTCGNCWDHKEYFILYNWLNWGNGSEPHWKNGAILAHPANSTAKGFLAFNVRFFVIRTSHCGNPWQSHSTFHFLKA